MCEDFSKIEDISETIRSLTRRKVGIFWDVERYPFPVGSHPDSIYKKIESYVRGNFIGEISIWAYVDEKGPWGDFLRKKTWESRIYFLPGGDKRVRRKRMFHDILLWKLDSPLESQYTSFLLVVSDEVRNDKGFFHKLELLNCIWNYEVWLVEPTRDYTLPDSDDWPALLLDQAFSFTEQREEEKERSLKKMRSTMIRQVKVLGIL